MIITAFNIKTDYLTIHFDLKYLNKIELLPLNYPVFKT